MKPEPRRSREFPVGGSISRLAAIAGHFDPASSLRKLYFDGIVRIADSDRSADPRRARVKDGKEGEVHADFAMGEKSKAEFDGQRVLTNAGSRRSWQRIYFIVAFNVPSVQLSDISVVREEGLLRSRVRR
jgi:hypothetical protein